MSTSMVSRIQDRIPTRVESPRVERAAGEHTRANGSLLSGVERKVLLWLAQRLPRWVTPDQLTGLGFVGCLGILAGYALSSWHPAFVWLASLGFAVNWFGDSLDGTLARYRKIERPRYGYFVDHAVDSVNMLLVALGLGLSPWVRLDLALLGICGYLMMSILSYLTTHVRGVFQLSYGPLGPTEARLLLVGLNTFCFFVGSPEIAGPGLGLVDGMVLLTGLGLVGLFIVQGLRGARELAKLEPSRN